MHEQEICKIVKVNADTKIDFKIGIKKDPPMRMAAFLNVKKTSIRPTTGKLF